MPRNEIEHDTFGPKTAQSYQGAGDKKAATMTVYGAATMTPEGREAIAKWMEVQARSLRASHQGYAARYTARYFVAAK